MNILPKKSWHVRTNKNIERVKRDEAQAAEEKKQIQERAALADQEARTALLRRKARQLTAAPGRDDHSQLTNDPDPDLRQDELAVQTAGDRETTFQHVDLFSHLSSENPKGEKNKEHEKEERVAKEKYERSIGLLTYLGQSSAEAQTTKPWYFRPPDRAAAATTAESQNESCIDIKRKAIQDPMLEMEKYLGVKRSKGADLLPALRDKKHLQSASPPTSMSTDHTAVSRHPMGRTTASPDEKRSTRHKHKGKRKKCKHRHDEQRAERIKEKRRKHGHKKDGSGSREENPGPSVEQLRAERLQREASERAKTNRLLSGERQEGGGADAEAKADRPGRYNSQFHPELARIRRKPFHHGGT